MDKVLSFALVNLFWFSLPLTGYVLIRLGATLGFVPKSIRAALKLVLEQPIFAVFFVSLVTAFTVLAPLVVTLYILGAPVKFLAMGYIALLVPCLLYLCFIVVRYLFSTTEHDPFKVKGQINFVKIISLSLVGVLIVDFIVASYLRSYALLDTDTYYHMTRVVAMLHNGFGIHSGYFTGVVDASYHVNIIFGLYTIPAKLFHYDPLTIWGYSYGFFRFIQWTSIFTLAYLLFKFLLKAGKSAVFYASLITMTAVILFSYHFFIATYPNQIVNVWLVAFVVGLMLWSRAESRLIVALLLTIALLITITHPTYAFVAVLFMIFWILMFIILKWQGNTVKALTKRVYPMIAVAVVLMAGPILTKMMPSFITSEQQHLNDPLMWHIFGMSMKAPSAGLPMSTPQWIAFGLAIIGAIYLIKCIWRQHIAVTFVVSLIIFPYIILYFPPVFTLFSGVLPVWVLERFTAMNVLQFILPGLGIVAISSFGLGVLMRRKNLSTALGTRSVMVGTILLTMVAAVVIAPIAYGQLLWTKPYNAYSYEITDAMRGRLGAVIPHGSRILTDTLHAYTLPALMPVNVMAVSLGHSTTAADTKNRLACQAEVFNTFKYHDLHATGVDFVVLFRSDPEFDAKNKILDSRNYLKQIFFDDLLLVYQFNKTGGSSEGNHIYRPCLDYGNNELKDR